MKNHKLNEKRKNDDDKKGNFHMKKGVQAIFGKSS